MTMQPPTAQSPRAGRRKPRVLFLNSCVSGGGPGRGLTLYLDHEHSEIDAHLVMPEQGVIAEKLTHGETVHYMPVFAERVRTPPPVWIRKIPLLNAIAGVVAMFLAGFKITKLAREIEPDVIYCNHMLAKPIGVYVGWRAGVPVVFHVRNIHDKPWVERVFYQWLGRRKSVRLIICNSAASQEPYAVHAAEKTIVVPNFVDLRRYDPARTERRLRNELGIPTDARVIGFVGRIVPWKGVDRLIRAFVEVKRQVPEAVLAIVGGNDASQTADLLGQYRELARELGVGDSVYFTGFRDDVAPYIIDFDLLALPSIAPEPFGRVIIESMALGVPAVINAHGGATEIVNDGVDGLWVRPNDVDDLAAKLAALLGDDARRHQFSARAAAVVRERYDSAALSRTLTDLICSACPAEEVAAARDSAAA